ncbi:MAG: hydantoinase B/oxoprolinase family protein [Alphaproteobacteria bacterium]|nr:hydantoinase B/oxoprolinase family protein [Alphaproteobacteria bacterium]
MRDIGLLELIRESLIAVVNEMRANVIRSSYSSIIYEGHDFSCALVAGDGRLVAQGDADNPIHIFAVPYSTAELVKIFAGDIHEGDIFLHNDPYTGGTHLNDILMLYPVFHEGELALFTAIRCHWGDVGGMTPGSLSGRVTEVYQEGLRIAPTRISDRGRMNTAFLDLLFDNMRISAERRGDFNTMLGASRKAAEHIGRLFQRFGGSRFLDSIEELIRRSEVVMRARITEIPNGTYHAEGYLDSNGHDPAPLLARLALTVAGDRLTADFSGSSPQTGGPTNVGPAMALNAVASVVKSYLDPRTPVNHGSFNPISVINPQGSFLNATLPAPCGGMVECRALMIALMVSALGQALPQRLIGDLKGGANHVYLSGPQPRSGSSGAGLFLFYEYPTGGTGATATADGNHAVRAFTEGDFNAVQSAEIAEMQCPIRIEQHAIREDSCGDGMYRGGCGLRRDVRVLSHGASLSVLADHAVIPPFGVAGGHSGAANRFRVFRDGSWLSPSPIPGKVGGFKLQKGDLVRIETSGGGGYGDPLDRDPRHVIRDVDLGYVTRERSQQIYGIVWHPGDTIDPEATAAHRDTLREARLILPVLNSPEPEFDGTRRRVWLPPALAAAHAIAEGDLVEISVSDGAAALRAWAALGPPSTSSQVPEEAIALGASGLAVLKVAPGTRVEVRALATVRS